MDSIWISNLCKNILVLTVNKLLCNYCSSCYGVQSTSCVERGIRHRTHAPWDQAYPSSIYSTAPPLRPSWTKQAPATNKASSSFKDPYIGAPSEEPCSYEVTQESTRDKVKQFFPYVVFLHAHIAVFFLL